MITNNGKEIIAKFLLGQAPSYATHIALGCGAKPNSTGDFSAKEVMDFEMIRVPISSRGFVNEDGITKLALSAEMPTESRYEISEVALWSAASNSAVTSSDSRILFSFDTNDINLPVVAGDAIFATTADNETLLSSIRKDRQEGSRFLNNTIFLRGDTSDINSSFVISDGSVGNSSHIHLDGRNINLSKNSPDDEIKIALSIIPQQESNIDIPDSTRIVIEFLQSEINPTVGYARLTHEVLNTDLQGDNRYAVITKKLKDLETSSEFSWTDVRMIRIYTSIHKNTGDANPSDEYYTVLDAIRFENLNSPNPLYVMSGYSVVETTLQRPIVKIANTSNYIEFRFSVGVG